MKQIQQKSVNRSINTTDKLNIKLKPTMMDDTTATKNPVQNQTKDLDSSKLNHNVSGQKSALSYKMPPSPLL